MLEWMNRHWRINFINSLLEGTNIMGTLQDVSDTIDAESSALEVMTGILTAVGTDVKAIKVDLDIISTLIAQLKAGQVTQAQIDALQAKAEAVKTKVIDLQGAATTVQNDTSAALTEAEGLKA